MVQVEEVARILESKKSGALAVIVASYGLRSCLKTRMKTKSLSFHATELEFGDGTGVISP
jgi:hypothetical protein